MLSDTATKQGPPGQLVLDWIGEVVWEMYMSGLPTSTLSANFKSRGGPDATKTAQVGIPATAYPKLYVSARSTTPEPLHHKPSLNTSRNAHLAASTARQGLCKQ